MKNKLLLFLVFSFAWASGAVVTEAELAALYDETNVQVYAEHRDCIASSEENRQVLVRLSMDHTIPWHVSLMANVCLERMEKAEEQDRFEVYDWNSDPECQPTWNYDLACGYPREIIPLFHKRLSEFGLWYRYLEHCLGKVHSICPIMKNLWVGLAIVTEGTPRFYAAKIAQEKTELHTRGNPGGEYMASYVLRIFAADGTLPDAAYTIVPFPELYHTMKDAGKREMLSYVNDLEVVRQWFDFYRRNGDFDPPLAERIRELQNAASTNRLPVSQTLAAGDVPGSETAAAPDPIQEVPPAPSSAKSVSRMALLFAIGFVLGIAFTRLWLSRKAMA